MTHEIPTSVGQINTAWFDSVLGGVEKATIVKVIHGTATKICVELDFSPPRRGSRRVWVKTGMEPHSADKRMDNVYAGEAFYYKALAGKYDTRTPECFYAATDAQGHSVLVLDDLARIGARFVEPVEAGSVDFVARALEAIARYQASSWMAPELHDIDWLRMGGSHRAYDFISWLYEPNHWREYAQRPRFQKLAPALRDRELLVKVHRKLQDDFWPQAPWALAHGDCHFGQAYRLPDGEVRLLDWQAVQIAHWAHDVSYFMAGALSVQDRRANDRELLRHYLKALADHGVEPPADEVAWRAYRAHAMHGIGWVMCPFEMQPEENCEVFTERFSTAALDLGSVDLILGGG